MSSAISAGSVPGASSAAASASIRSRAAGTRSQAEPTASTASRAASKHFVIAASSSSAVTARSTSAGPSRSRRASGVVSGGSRIDGPVSSAAISSSASRDGNSRETPWRIASARSTRSVSRAK